jgi:hypothetical protein
MASASSRVGEIGPVMVNEVDLWIPGGGHIVVSAKDERLVR